jgi:hypothetical protein
MEVVRKLVLAAFTVRKLVLVALMIAPFVMIGFMVAFVAAAYIGDMTGWYRLENYMTLSDH